MYISLICEHRPAIARAFEFRARRCIHDRVKIRGISRILNSIKRYARAARIVCKRRVSSRNAMKVRAISARKAAGGGIKNYEESSSELGK